MKTDRIEIARVILSTYKSSNSINPRSFFIHTDDVLTVIKEAGFSINSYWCSKIMRSLSFSSTCKKINGKTARGFFVVKNENPDLLDIDNRLQMISHTIENLQSKEKIRFQRQNEYAHESTEIYDEFTPEIPAYFTNEKAILRHIMEHWDYYKRFMPPSILKYQKNDPNLYTLSSFKLSQVIENAGFFKAFVHDQILLVDKSDVVTDRKKGKDFRDRLEAVSKL